MSADAGAQLDRATQIIAERKERERLADIALENDYEARLIIDLNGVVIYANKRARLITAHPDLVGKNFRILVPPRFAVVHETHFLGFLNDPRSRTMGVVGADLALVDGRGIEKAVALSLNPLEDPDGPMRVCVGIVVLPAKK